jgi:antitoxin ParD1/3/4
MSMLKISVTIPDDLMVFMSFYGARYNEPNRSHIIQKALKLLREKELDLAYMQANSEIDHAFDVSSGDGLHD